MESAPSDGVSREPGSRGVRMFRVQGCEMDELSASHISLSYIWIQKF